MMEGKKKKNESRAHTQKRFIAIVAFLILVLLFGLGLLAYMIIQNRPLSSFDMTATTIVSTNYPVPYIFPTDYFITESFIMTSTALP